MEIRKVLNKHILIPSMAILLVLTGCASANNAAESSGTGVVTETNLTDTVESSGSVAARQLATLTWGTSGNVLEVNASTNEKVVSGEILMTLDSTSAPAEVIQAVSTLVTAQQNLVNATESNTSLAQAEVALNTAKQAYFEALGYSYTLGKPVGSEDYNAILKANLIAAQESVDRAETNFNGFAETPDSDTRKAAARASLAQARIALEDAQAIYNYYTSTPNATDSAEIQANLSLAKAQMEDAQRAYDALKDGENTDAITSAQAAVDAAQATVNKLNIIAPFDGEIAVVYSQAGDVVSTGTKALVLVDRSKLYVDVAIDETSISSVQIGNPAEITFDALNGLSASGKVTRIDPIGMVSSGVVNFTVRVELDKSDPSILIGATATVLITTGEPQSMLLVPISAVLNDSQGEYVIRVSQGNTAERVSVVSGQIFDDTVVVAGDLQAGDVVQLYTQSSSSSTSGNEMRGGFTTGVIGGEPPSDNVRVP